LRQRQGGRFAHSPATDDTNFALIIHRKERLIAEV
jgi:hypothetical protein